MGVEIHAEAKLRADKIHAKVGVAANVGGVRVAELTIFEGEVELDGSKVRFHKRNSGMRLSGYLQWKPDRNELKCKVEACVGSGIFKVCDTARVHIHVET